MSNNLLKALNHGKLFINYRKVCTVRKKLFMLVPTRVLCTSDSSRAVHKVVEVIHVPAPR